MFVVLFPNFSLGFVKKLKTILKLNIYVYFFRFMSFITTNLYVNSVVCRNYSDTVYVLHVRSRFNLVVLL